MRFLIYVFLFISFPTYSQSWVGKDSIYTVDTEQRIYKSNFLSHNLSAPLNFGEVSLSYRNSNGARRLAQQAHNRQQVDFYAIGANQLGDFRISGDFLFNKVFDDSLSFGQRNDIDEWTTFNYFASKAGKYERQNYKANLTLSYKFNDLIQPFFNVNYLSHWTTGSVDPRFESKKFEMKYNPGLILNFEETKLGIKALLGKGRDNTGVSYKNKNYSQSLLYPDRIHYLNLGYGKISIRDTASTRRYSSLAGGELTGHTQLGHVIIDLSASAEYRNDNLTNDSKSAQTYRTRAIYKEDIYKFSGNIQVLDDSYHHLITMEGQYLNGHDGLIEFSANFDKVNYTVNYQTGRLGYLLTKKDYRIWGYDVGLDVEYYNINRQDYASNIHVKNSFLHLTPHGRLYYKSSTGDLIQFAFNPKTIVNINDEITYSINSINNYIESVVLWDYDYYKTNAWKLDWNAKWITNKVSNQYLFGIYANYAMERNMGTTRSEMLSKFLKQAKRNYFSIGVFLNI